MPCPCGGYQYQDEYSSRMMEDFFEKSPHEKEELDQFLEQYVTYKQPIEHVRKAIWCLLCADCNTLRIRFKSKLDQLLDEHRSSDTY